MVVAETRRRRAYSCKRGHPSGAPILKPCKFAVTPVCDRRTTAEGGRCPAHVHAKTGVTAPLARIQGAPVGGMTRTERRLRLKLPRVATILANPDPQRVSRQINPSAATRAATTAHVTVRRRRDLTADQWQRPAIDRREQSSHRGGEAGVILRRPDR
jgi:hypothetical protein